MTMLRKAVFGLGALALGMAAPARADAPPSATEAVAAPQAAPTPQAVAAPRAAWMPLDDLNQSDFDQAQAEFMPMFGLDPALWPDWLDRVAVLLPAGRGASWLVVREPVKAECGGYSYSVFGPAPPEGGRAKLGEAICAGDMQVQPRPGQRPPDLLFTGPGSLDDAAERPVQQWRWSDKGWGIVKQ